MESCCELLIVGAGPAGISTALHLLQIDPGWSERLLVLEKAVHPRPKLCGGGLTRLGLYILQDLGFDLPLPLSHESVEDVQLIYSGRTIHVRGQPQFAVFHRPELDAYLVDQARSRGVKILEDQPVEALALESDKVLVTAQGGVFRCRAVVGADGSKGVTQRYVHKGMTGKRVARLLEVHDCSSEVAPHSAERTAYFDFTPLGDRLQGYFWEFPSRLGGQPAFNYGVYDARLAHWRPRADLPSVFGESMTARGELLQNFKLEGHPINLFSPFNRFAIPRLLLVGDAAGTDPLFGEGIAPALGYGRVAARTLHQAFRRGEFSFRDYRKELLGSQLGRYLLLRWLVAWWGYRLGWSSIFMHLLWTVGDILARLWPEPGSLYHDRRPGEVIKD
ncbi:MAG TPA: FAD-dependent monooxygenase [Anaerolineales bacterium]|nr:FAD-dependent monooxygenase [Anaerolineales bacterium]